ncbi:DUF1272 domain-containing protein [Empedobacter sp. UBA6745]|uniref:DUF1272 domain-containing protein n=1 Tax=Empedobacter sp. UBA6745 TaxID=1946447 RepID=UPI0025C4D957|nr:DUF1272 domain-containing protein [Empedobacter sp. UBA6745]
MLELRPNCENCGKNLLPNSTETMICTFEYTFCKDCVDNVLENVCPNCGGNFTPRPIRPNKYLSKYPASTQIVLKKVNLTEFENSKEEFKDILPENR